jgi:hypothetical protein
VNTPTARTRAILEHLEAHPELDYTVSIIHVSFKPRVQLFVRDEGGYFAALVAWARTLTDTKPVQVVYGSGYQLTLSGVMDGGMRLDEVVAVLGPDEGRMILREVDGTRGTIEVDTLARLADELAAKRASVVTA